MGKRDIKIIEEKPDYDKSASFLNIGKLQNLIGPFPLTPLEQGFEKLIKDLK